MSTEAAVEGHYRRGGLGAAIRHGLAATGKTDEITTADLAPVDEFHIGGRQATVDLLAHVSLDAAMHVLDVGSGIGGPARHIAESAGCQVTGIDLTAEHVEIAHELSCLVGLDTRVKVIQGSALSIPFDDATFDAAFMLHVGMNIADKQTLLREVGRVMRPGAVFAIYDVMRVGDAEVRYPVPWAAVSDTSFLATPAAYRAAAETAGFIVEAERERSVIALDFFTTIRAQHTPGAPPPPLGLHLVLGPDAPAMVDNMIANTETGAIAPVEMICRRTPVNLSPAA